ncbi:uncharacterized protein [Venturia canescens]|uniref:uncharacterized protein n=1 Tax=Venturia canescens TaxID=32260 RepID=UPI001C9BD9E0|nr:uncharacterized protein LOC122418918 [Venturia canescens]XP_043288988.1 uncharacterized protein LOC122418918 [Venturia canescens]
MGCNMLRTHNSLIFIVATCVLCLTRSTICIESPSNKEGVIGNGTKLQEKKPIASVGKGVIELNGNKTNKSPPVQQTGKNITSQSAATTVVDNKLPTDSISSSEPSTVGHSQPAVNAGALFRGLYVLGGLSVIALAYMVFRSFGVNKQRPQMIRKYGILAHKQDIEMRPLPLDEDDEDDTTVFDVSGLASSRIHS